MLIFTPLDRAAPKSAIDLERSGSRSSSLSFAVHDMDYLYGTVRVGFNWGKLEYSANFFMVTTIDPATGRRVEEFRPVPVNMLFRYDVSLESSQRCSSRPDTLIWEKDSILFRPTRRVSFYSEYAGSRFNSFVGIRKAFYEAIASWRAKGGIPFSFEDCAASKSVDDTPVYYYDVKALPSVDSGFYPTPSHVAGQLFSMLPTRRFYSLNTILEPSAGKGDLVSHFVSYMCGSTSRSNDQIKESIDVIEIDANLQMLLLSKGYRIIHDDFLTFNSRKSYDLILMNPPFDNAVHHILHAIQLQQYGGCILAICNAETIRNPYSQSRQTLLHYIEQYGKVQYVQRGFSNAERKTNVECALIYIEIPNKCFSEERSDFWDSFHKASECVEEETSVYEGLSVMSGDTISQWVQLFNEEVDATLAFIRQYEAFKPHILTHIDMGVDKDKSPKNPAAIISLSLSNGKNVTVNEVIKLIRRKYWTAFAHNSDVLDRLTSTLRAAYISRLESMDSCDFSEFNLRKLAAQINMDMFSGIKEDIDSLYYKLTAAHTYYPECTANIHYYNGWKSNKATAINTKVIIPVNGMFAYSWSAQAGNLDFYNVRAFLADIEKVLNFLDGHRTAEVNLDASIKNAVNNGITKNISCKYFSVTFYKKGTCHIKFHDRRIVDIFNIYMGKRFNTLPPYYGYVQYEDLSSEEQRIVDDFQGKSVYDEISSNPDMYMFDVAKSVPVLTSGSQ